MMSLSTDAGIIALPVRASATMVCTICDIATGYGLNRRSGATAHGTGTRTMPARPVARSTARRITATARVVAHAARVNTTPRTPRPRRSAMAT